MRFQAQIPGLTLFTASGERPHWSNQISPEQIVAIAQRAETAGFESITVPWHLVMAVGESVANFGARWPHSMAAGGFLLGATRRITLMPLVVVPCEPPVAMAKAIATLDWMSGGRIAPVLLAGYLDFEFKFLGVPLAERGPIMDEYIDAMIELWTADEPRFRGRYVEFADIAFEPKPRQRPLPLWFGGRAKPALRRIARYGVGWKSYATPHADIPAAVEYIKSQPEFIANPRPLGVFAYFIESSHDPVSHAQVRERRRIVGNDAIFEQLEYLASVGVNLTYAPLDSYAGTGGAPKPIESFEEYMERLDWFAEEIAPLAAGIGSARAGAL